MGEMSVGEMSVREISVGEISGRRKVGRRNVCRLFILVPFSGPIPPGCAIYLGGLNCYDFTTGIESLISINFVVISVLK